MAHTKQRTLVLASASPRRREYLALLGIEYQCCAADVDETISQPLPPERYATELARRKARAVAKQHPGRFVLGADTIVVYQDRILGKPESEEDAYQMLHALQDGHHEVVTGLCVVAPDGAAYEQACVTSVWMAPMDEREIRCYIATGEPMDKAGAYGIQGRGAALIEKINGCYFNVVGLPIRATKLLLERAGYLFF